MRRVIRLLSAPAGESHLEMALAVAAVTLALMLWAVIWQSNVILYQRDIIRWMWDARIGS